MWFRVNASRQRAPLRWLLQAFVLLSAVCPASPAAAQGLLQQLFGFGAPPPPVQMPLPQSQRPKANTDLAVPGGQRDHEPKPASSGTYRTVCVRMCDGFYIPMSFATTRESFMQDQAKCRSTCGGEARLFVHRNPGGAIDDAVDLSGRPYSAMPTAFKFRKTLVQGCSCRPPPWSEAELARHKSYAAAPQVGAPGVAATKVAEATAPARQYNVETAAPSGPIAEAPRASERAGDRAAAKPRKLARAETNPNEDPAPEHPKRRMAATPPPKPIRVAAHVPPAPAYVIAPKPSGGLFGSGMGLGVQPKYKWPGD